MKKLTYSTLTIALLSATNIGFSLDSTPSATVMGMLGENASTWADGMWPLYVDDNRIAYIDAQAQGASTDAGILSLGAGYRIARTPKDILGAYLFVDRARSDDKAYFTVLGPGVEKITPTWSYRLNAYFPIGDKKQLTDSGWSSDLDIYDDEYFEGHSEYDSHSNVYQELSYGGDFSIGYHFAKDTRWAASITPYAYRMKDEQAMLGTKAQISYYPDEYTEVFVGNGYDNYNHNRIYTGVSFSFGARSHNSDQQSLMATPIYRNLNVNTTDDGLATNETYTSGEVEERYDDVYFVDNETGSSDGDGTYENPYADVDQAVTDSGEDTRIYVENTGTNYQYDDDITLQEGQGIYGRSDDFLKASTGSNQTTIEFTDSDGFIGTSSNDFSDLTILGSGYSETGSNTAITIYADSDDSEVAQINDVHIGTTDSSSSYQTGIYMDDGSKAEITNSTVIAYLYDGEDDIDEVAIGIDSEGANTLTVNNSTIEAIADNLEDDTNGSFAINMDNYGGSASDAMLTINNSTLNAISTQYYTTGIYVAGATLNMNNSTINTQSPDYPWGIWLEGETDATITNSIIDTEATNGDGSIGIYGDGEEGSTFTLTNSTLITNGDEESIGVELEYYDDDIYIAGNTITTDGSYEAIGVYLSEDTGTNIITNNTFNSAGPYGAYGIYLDDSSLSNNAASSNDFNLSSIDEDDSDEIYTY